MEVAIILVSIGFVGVSEKSESSLFPEAKVSSNASNIWIQEKDLVLGSRKLFDIRDDDSISERFVNR